MGLRLADGVARAAFLRETACQPEQLLDACRLSELIDGGFLELDTRALRATSDGRARLNAVLARLLQAVPVRQ